VFLGCLCTRLKLKGSTGPRVLTAEHSVGSQNQPSLKGLGEKSRYGAVILETVTEGATWDLMSWSFASLSLFASSLPLERLPVILGFMALGLLCPSPVAATGCAGLKYPRVLVLSLWLRHHGQRYHSRRCSGRNSAAVHINSSACCLSDGGRVLYRWFIYISGSTMNLVTKHQVSAVSYFDSFSR